MHKKRQGYWFLDQVYFTGTTIGKTGSGEYAHSQLIPA